jgi:hypothetical protein
MQKYINITWNFFKEKFKGDHQRIILAKLESNWPSSLRGNKLKFYLGVPSSGQDGRCYYLLTLTELPDTILEGDHQQTIPPKFGLKWPSGFRGEYF